MNNKDICFVRPIERGNEYWDNTIKSYGFNTAVPYKDHSVIMRIAREIWFRLHLPKEIWFDKNIDDIEASTIIVKDVLICKEYIEWLRKRKPNSRLILDFDNRVYTSIDPNSIQVQELEKWTYDPDDATNYGMKLKEPGYFEIFTRDIKREKAPLYDIVYVGRDKGRAEFLLSLEEGFISQGLKTYFHISPTRRFLLYCKKFYKPVMRYEKYLTLINQSRANLNIVPDGQKALTLRDFETVFFGIKSITNNKSIKEFELYDKSRFFILGEDKMEDLQSFVMSDFKPVEREDLKKYFFCNSLEITLSDICHE